MSSLLEIKLSRENSNKKSKVSKPQMLRTDNYVVHRVLVEADLEQISNITWFLCSHNVTCLCFRVEWVLGCFRASGRVPELGMLQVCSAWQIVSTARVSLGRPVVYRAQWQPRAGNMCGSLVPTYVDRGTIICALPSESVTTLVTFLI